MSVETIQQKRDELLALVARGRYLDMDIREAVVAAIDDMCDEAVRLTREQIESVAGIDSERLAEAMQRHEYQRAPGAYPHLGQPNDIRLFALWVAAEYEGMDR